MTTNGTQRFGEVLRVIRMGKHLKQREMAALAGVSPGSIANAESSVHATFSLKRLETLCDNMKLDSTMRALLVRLHGECPKSEFQIKQAERWASHKANRIAISNAVGLDSELALARLRISELESHPSTSTESAIRDALIHMVDHAPDGAACECDLDPTSSGYLYQCPLCHAMRALGYEHGYLGRYDAAVHIGSICDPNADHLRLTEAQAEARRHPPEAKRSPLDDIQAVDPNIEASDPEFG